MENLPQRLVYFNRTKQSFRKSEYKSKPSVQSEIKTDMKMSPESAFEDINVQTLKCSGSCSALQKTFQHQDELDLHNLFYHAELDGRSQ